MADPFKNIDFAHIYNQIYREEMSRIHEFNILLVGTTGVGKSALVKSLFDGKIRPDEPVGEPVLNYYQDLIEENGVRCRISCLETSNFDQLDPDVYINYIDDKFKQHFVDRIRLPFWKIPDYLIHCCIFMIPPHGKLRLRYEEIECMKLLHERVNLVPVIAKADSFNSSQIAKFKENVLDDLKKNGIKYFEFQFDEKEDEERAKVVKSLAERFPFAIVSADEPTIIEKKPRWIRETGRPIDIMLEYDFDALAKLVNRHCPIDLIETTYLKHYQKFRLELFDTLKKDSGDQMISMGLEPYEVAGIQRDLNKSN